MIGPGGKRLSNVNARPSDDSIKKSGKTLTVPGQEEKPAHMKSLSKAMYKEDEETKKDMNSAINNKEFKI